MRHKHFILISFFCFVAGLTAEAATATTYTVKAGGGGNFTTISACINAMSASGGDTCVVYAGSYAEKPSIKAGTSGNYNVLTVNAGDTVSILGSTISSHTKINGFTITNPSNPASGGCVIVPAGTTDAYITSNKMSYCGGSAATEPASLAGQRNGAVGSSFIYVQNNTITHGCSAPGVNDVCESISIAGDHWLIEGNDLSHNDDSIEFYASYVIARNNTIHDVNTSECTPSSAGGHGSNCHADIFESEPVAGVTPTSAHNMFEGNTAKNLAGTVHGVLMQGDACSGQCIHGIVRYNVYSNLAGYYVLNDLPTFSYVKTYNESLAGGGPGDYSSNFNGAAADTSSMINDVLYQFSGSTPSNYYYGSPIAHNILINPVISPFVNAGSDWHLALGSVAIGAGGPMTTATALGTNSTTLVVADAYYFQDGWGFPNGTGIGQVSPDWIRIGATTKVQISSINYATNTITLASAASWNSGDPIYLYKKSDGAVVLTGLLPDIGAIPSGLPATLPQAPTNLTAIVN